MIHSGGHLPSSSTDAGSFTSTGKLLCTSLAYMMPRVWRRIKLTGHRYVVVVYNHLHRLLMFTPLLASLHYFFCSARATPLSRRISNWRSSLKVSSKRSLRVSRCRCSSTLTSPPKLLPSGVLSCLLRVTSRACAPYIRPPRPISCTHSSMVCICMSLLFF